MARLLYCTDSKQFLVKLDQGDDWGRAHRILKAAVLTIDDRVVGLYEGQTAPERVSELEKGNYVKGRR